MKAFSFNVTIAATALDCEVIEDTIRQALAEGLPEETLALCKADGVKEYSEQGWKVARNRKFGIDAKSAGDAHKAIKSKIDTATPATV
ncbi:MAG TPA: hypothetical protein DCM04_05025 [Saprospirales bacterium]|nr:hypothetical protein [Saprospirales bacterium]|tara:strand:- start:437 stop:700 length:264 start_codon:yes stop_codon:yes gene_type:complete